VSSPTFTGIYRFFHNQYIEIICKENFVPDKILDRIVVKVGLEVPLESKSNF